MVGGRLRDRRNSWQVDSRDWRNSALGRIPRNGCRARQGSGRANRSRNGGEMMKGEGGVSPRMWEKVRKVGDEESAGWREFTQRPIEFGGCGLNSQGK